MALLVPLSHRLSAVTFTPDPARSVMQRPDIEAWENLALVVVPLEAGLGSHPTDAGAHQPIRSAYTCTGSGVSAAVLPCTRLAAALPSDFRPLANSSRISACVAAGNARCVPTTAIV